MKYEIIFRNGFTDDSESLISDYRGDILILDEAGNCYQPEFLTLQRIKNFFGQDKKCFLSGNMVILHEVTRQTILDSIPDLHAWMFYENWQPISIEMMGKRWLPEDWDCVTVVC